MKTLPLRLVRIVLVGAGAYAVYLLLEPLGMSWLVLPLAVGVILGWMLFRWRKGRRIAAEVAREEKWSAAVLDGARRPQAIEEVKAALAEVDGVADRVRLTVLLSDLVDAEGDREEAQRLLEALDYRSLPAIECAVVRHALATLRFRAGDPEGAREVLQPRAPRTGDIDLDRRLELLDATADLELGEADKALETAIRIRRAAGADEALALEARIVRAAALDARGDHAEAISALNTLGPEVVEALTHLGGPRIRALAEEAAA
jgi:hypothetical protein